VRGLAPSDAIPSFDIFDAAIRNLGGFQDVVFETTPDSVPDRK